MHDPDFAPSGTDLDPPDWLTEAQQATWRQIVGNLAHADRRNLDTSQLATWVVAESQHRTAATLQEKVDEGSSLPLLTKGRAGPVPSPYLAVMSRASEQMRKAAAALGFRPDARLLTSGQRSAVSVQEQARPEAPPYAEDDETDAAGTLLVNKRELAIRIGCSLPTLAAWLDRYGDDFPVLERGTNGRNWKFDAHAVIAFLTDRRAEEREKATERDEQLAQLVLPLDLLPAGAPQSGLTLDDQLKASKLREALRREGLAAGALVPAAAIEDAYTAIFATWNRELHGFVRQLAREHRWPEEVLRDAEARLAEIQSRLVDGAPATLTEADPADARQLRFA